MSRKYLVVTLVVLLGIWLLGGCSGTSVNSANNVGERISNATEDNPFVTELIAGAGQGWPGTGTDVGEVSVWNDGTNLYVKYETTGDFYFGGGGVDNLHLWVGEDASVLPGVAPGQFPWSYAVPGDGTSYTFTIPLSGNYPAGGYMDGAAYDWSAGETLEIAAHALACSTDGDGGGGGGSSTFCTYEVDGTSGDTITIWAGQNINAGTAFLSFFEDGGDTYMEIDIALSGDWVLCDSDHLWVGTTHNGYPQVESGPNKGTPKFGQFPYVHTFSAPYPTTDTFIVNLSQDVDGFEWVDDMAHICFVLHVVVCRDNDGDGTYEEHQTGIAWVPGEDDFPGNRWGGSYCFDVTRNCGEEPCDGCDDEGGETCQTAWGFDSDGDLTNDDGSNIGDGTSKNEDGWFPNYFGINRWGWIFEYLVTDNS